MFPPLYDDDRRILARTAGMLMLGAAAVLPITAPTSSIASAQAASVTHTIAEPALPGPMTFPSFSLKRDPFRSDRVQLKVQADSIGVVLPPNLGAAGDVSGAIALRAVVLGEHSRVLVDLGGDVQVLGIGDRVGNQRIASIDSAGVTFTDGSRLPLEQHK